MMILGFCGLGFMAYRRKQNGAALSVAYFFCVDPISKAALTGAAFVCWSRPTKTPSGVAFDCASRSRHKR
jgi:hypothetical protein